jgi:hypothetical protein
MSRPVVRARWLFRVGEKQVPRGYTLGPAGNLRSQKRALRRQLERTHGKLSGRQWVRLRRALK